MPNQPLHVAAAILLLLAVIVRASSGAPSQALMAVGLITVALVLLIGHLTSGPRAGTALGLLVLLGFALLWQFIRHSHMLAGWDIFREMNIALYAQPLFGGIPIGTAESARITIPVLADISGLAPMSVARWLVPTLYAFLPVSLYLLYRRTFGLAIASAGILVVLTNQFYYYNAPNTMRVMLAVLCMLPAAWAISRMRSSAGAIVFFVASMGTILNHYGLSILFAVVMVVGAIIGATLRRPEARDLWFAAVPFGVLVVSHFGLLFRTPVFSFFVDAAQAFLVGDVEGAIRRPGVEYLPNEESYEVLGATEMGLTALVILLVGLGLVRRLRLPRNDQSLFLAAGAYSVLGLSVIFPFLGQQYSIFRVLHFALLFVAPYAIVGLLPRAALREKQWPRWRSIGLSCALAVYLLVGTSALSVLAGETPQSIRGLVYHDPSALPPAAERMVTVVSASEEVFSAGAWIATEVEGALCMDGALQNKIGGLFNVGGIDPFRVRLCPPAMLAVDADYYPALYDRGDLFYRDARVERGVVQRSLTYDNGGYWVLGPEGISASAGGDDA